MRVHSIKTTYLIHETLVKDSEVKKLINENNVFLVIGEPEATYPYAIITRSFIRSGSRNKDFVSDIVSFNIKVYAQEYNIAADIADAMRFALENHILSDSLIKISNIEVTNVSESWNGDAYLQNMDFQCEVENNTIQNSQS